MSEGSRTAEQRAADERRGPPPVRQGPGRGVAMVAERPKHLWATARRFLGLLRPERVLLSVVLSCGLVSVVLSASGPRILGRATDLVFAGVFGQRIPASVTQQQAAQQLRDQGQHRLADMVAAMPYLVPGQSVDFGAVGRVLALALGVYAAAAVLMWVQGHLVAAVVQRTVYRLREQVEDHLHRLELPYFDTQPRGEILSRVTNDIDNTAQSLQQVLTQLIMTLLTVLAMIAMMISLSPLLSVVVLVSIPVTIAITAVVARRSQPQFRRQWKHTGELNAIVEETLTGHELVKVYGQQDRVRADFAATNDRLFDATFTAQFISGLITPLTAFAGSLSYVAIAVVGGLRVATGSMSLGEVQAFIQYSRQFTQPLTQVASTANLVQSGLASAERVFDLLDAPLQSPEPDADGPAAALEDTPSAQRGRVEFSDVSFSYSADAPLIRDLSLVVEPGHTVAIVGPTGAGKTTLVNLIMRFYALDSGRISLDGVDIGQLSRHQLRSRIGMVLQDTWLFNGSIADNIAYGKPGATTVQVRAAAEATYADKFIHSMPAGYDTLIDEQGSNISAGERQLITIARAFIADPDLLILDEATSAVDTRTERAVQQAMTALRRRRTSFVIAHRLSTIVDADLILVMSGGRIVEQGTHEQLIAAAGAYADLYRTQFSRAAVAEDGAERA